MGGRMLENIKGFDSWLPVFPGFYNTIFEPDLDEEVKYCEDEGFYMNDYKQAFLANSGEIVNLL